MLKYLSHYLYNEKEEMMSEPLFLQSVMQEKIWGGTKLRDEFTVKFLVIK